MKLFFFARGVKINTGLGENVYVLNTEVPFTDKMGLEESIIL